jgi:hypothetical protein
MNSFRFNYKQVKRINENYSKVKDSSSSYITKDLYKLSDQTRGVDLKPLSKIKHSNLLKIDCLENDCMVEEGCTSVSISNLSKIQSFACLFLYTTERFD